MRTPYIFSILLCRFLESTRYWNNIFKASMESPCFMFEHHWYYVCLSH